MVKMKKYPSKDMKQQYRFPFPRKISGSDSQTVRFPVGGIGTGTISIDANGRLCDWEIFSRPDKGKSPRHSMTTIYVSSKNGKNSQARVVEGLIQPPYNGSKGLGRNNLPGLSRFENTSFSAVYPFANIDFFQRGFPVEISLEAFNPIVPLDVNASSLPIVILSYRVTNKTKVSQKCCMAHSLTNFMNEQYCTNNKIVKNKNLKAVQLFYKDKHSGHKIDGSICISADGPKVQVLPNWDNSEDRDEGLAFWDQFSKYGQLPESQKKLTASTGSVASSFTLKPNQTKIIRFYITWHFKHRTLGWCGWEKTGSKYFYTDVGNHYALQYKDAWDAMNKIVPRIGELENKSRLFVDNLKKSSLPPEVLDALFANMSTLRTQTMFRTADGKFHGFEGCDDTVGCCEGDCNHVYNYELATSSLFPQITRSLISTALFENTDNRGATALERPYRTFASAL